MSFEDYFVQSTNHTITNTIIELEQDPLKTFHWSDLAFFNRWWNDQTELKKESV